MEVQYECTLEEKTRVQAILDYWEKQPQEEYKMEFFDEEEKIAFNHLVNCVQDRKQFDFQWSTTPDQEGIMIQNQLELVTQLFSHYQVSRTLCYL